VIVAQQVVIRQAGLLDDPLDEKQHFKNAKGAKFSAKAAKNLSLAGLRAPPLCLLYV